MGAPLQIRTVADQIYDAMLSSAYKNSWIYDNSYALSKDSDIFEVILRDASFASSIDRFQNSVVRPFRVEAPKGTKNTQSKRAARIVEEALRQSMLFDDMRKRLALGRVLGRSYEFTNWEPVECALADNPPMQWMIPVSWENIDRRRIRWVPQWGEDGIYSGTADGPLTTKRYLWSITRNAWLPMSDDFRNAIIEDIYPLSEDRLGQGRGCADNFYIYAYYKAIFLQKMSQGADRWANGMLVGKIDSARLASLPKTSGAVQTAMATVLQTARSEHVIVLDKADEIEVINGGMEGHQMCMDGIRYFDESVERLLNGSIRGSGHGQQNGARAASETESDTSEAFYQPYRQHQDEILTRDVIGYFWNHPLNRQNFLKMGLGIAERPHFTSEQIKKKTPLEAIQVITAARQAGIPLLKSEVYEDIEKTMPEPGEDVFDGALAMPGEGGMDLDSSGAPQGLKPDEAKQRKEEDRNHELEMVKAKGEKEKAEFQHQNQSLKAELDSLKSTLTRLEAQFQAKPEVIVKEIVKEVQVEKAVAFSGKQLVEKMLPRNRKAAEVKK